MQQGVMSRDGGQQPLSIWEFRDCGVTGAETLDELGRAVSERTLHELGVLSGQAGLEVSSFCIRAGIITSI